MTRLLRKPREAHSGRNPGRVWLLNAALLAIAAALHLALVTRLDPALPGVRLPWWSVALLFAAAEVFVVHLHLERDTHTFSLNELPLVLGLFFLAPEQVVVAQVLGGGAALLLHRRQPPVKFAFNVSRWCFETTLAVLLFHLVLRLGEPLGPSAWAAAFVATFMIDFSATTLIGVAIALSERKPPVFPRHLAIGHVATFTNTTLALTAVTIVIEHATAVWMTLVLSVAVFVAYRAFAYVTDRHESLRVLHESTRVDVELMDLEGVVHPVLQRAREMFRADVAEATLFATGGGSALRTTIGPSDEVTPLSDVELDPTEGVWARVAAEGRGMLLARPIESDKLREHFARRGIREALVAPVRGKSGIVGTILVANRLRDVGTFDDADLELFETLVNHASVWLENFRLVDDLRRQAAENEHQALHDRLTGLPNRTLFQERCRDAIAAAERTGTQVAVVLMDLDRFKEVNDTLGHGSGDLLLQEMGRRLQETVRPSDTVARLGGDEFAVLLPEVGGRTGAVRVAEEILDALKRPIVLQELTLDVGGSLGITLFPDHGNDAESLLQRADVAMYLAKGAHSGYEVYQHERNQYTPRRLALVAELRGAIERSELTVLYQPKADLTTGEVVGVEALVRWDHPRHGLQPPDTFIPVAENTGLIKPLTMNVLDSSLAQCRAWTLAGRSLKVAVNLSARNLLDSELPNDVGRLLRKWDVPATCLQLEITESTIMADPVRTAEILARLSKMGVGVAVDDFGTGYSSLSHLSKLPVDEVKIDKSFVLDMVSDENAAVIVRSIIDLARNLDLRVVAEGVENRTIWNRLAMLGCDQAQGYFLGRPMSVARFDEWLTESSRLFAAMGSASS